MRLRDRVSSLAEGVLIAIDALRANKVRAALTILGIAIGVFVVVLMSAVIHGINSSVAQEFEKAGPDDVLRLPLSDRARGVQRRRGLVQVAEQPTASRGRGRGARATVVGAGRDDSERHAGAGQVPRSRARGRHRCRPTRRTGSR